MPERPECTYQDCHFEGQFSVKLVIPHVGRPDDRRPFTGILGIRLCRRHAEEFTAAQILEAPDQRLLAILNMPHLVGGKLDLARAYTTPLRCSSEEFQTFLRIQRAPRPD